MKLLIFLFLIVCSVRNGLSENCLQIDPLECESVAGCMFDDFNKVCDYQTVVRPPNREPFPTNPINPINTLPDGIVPPPSNLNPFSDVNSGSAVRPLPISSSYRPSSTNREPSNFNNPRPISYVGSSTGRPTNSVSRPIMNPVYESNERPVNPPYSSIRPVSSISRPSDIKPINNLLDNSNERPVNPPYSSIRPVSSISRPSDIKPINNLLDNSNERPIYPSSNTRPVYSNVRPAYPGIRPSNLADDSSLDAAVINPKPLVNSNRVPGSNTFSDGRDRKPYNLWSNTNRLPLFNRAKWFLLQNTAIKNFHH